MKEGMRKIFIGPGIYIAIAFVIWLFCFRGYFLGKLGLTSDAVSYYEHIRFFLTNLKSGHFSLWDPYWSGGVPNDFFLRRFCPYNPFYFFIILLNTAGVPYYFSYIFFLAFYLFFGMVGFYLLSRKLSGDEVAAFVSFAVLLFSSLSTRIFDSYMIFVVTPLVWFFFFLVSFANSPKRINALGLTFFAMLTITTYIPLFFIVIFLSFLIVFIIVYCNKFGGSFVNMAGFVIKERWTSIFCVIAILLSIIPGIIFFQEAGKGNIAIPGRHFNAVESHALAVRSQAEDSWAVPEEFFFSAYYHDLKRITFAIVYVPCFALILLAIGLGLRVSRLMVFLVTWGASVLLLASPFASPLYSFLREKIFFFKYFRNLHFLLWFALFPIFALLIGEMFRSFRNEVDKRADKWMVAWVIMAHVFLLWVVCLQPSALLMTKATVVFSAIFFVLYCSARNFRAQKSLVLGALLAIIVAQPSSVYHYFAKNVPARAAGFYDDLKSGYHYVMYLAGEGKKEGESPRLRNYPDKPTGSLYYATSYYNDLRANVPLSLIAANEKYRFMAYDQVGVESNSIDWGKLASLWRHNENTALIEAGYTGPRMIGESGLPHPMVFGSASDTLRIIKGTTDKVDLDINFPSAKMLVFNDSFFQYWRVFVNGKRERIWRVNGAFKGVIVPAGPAKVVFIFGLIGQRFLNLVLLVLFYGIAFSLFIYFLKQRIMAFSRSVL